MNDLAAKSRLFVKRHGSTILTTAGGVGVVATSIMAIKATPKALVLLEEAKEEKGENLTKLEIAMIAGPAYIPTVVMGVSTLACVFGANMLNKRQQASLISAYALLDNSYSQYKEKIAELYGDEANNRVREEIAKDKYEDEDITVEEGKELFYDDFSGRYFESTKAIVQRAEYQINRNIFQREYAYLNEFYDELGIDTIDGGWDLGWSPGANELMGWQSWLDFNHHHTVMDDGLECTIISFCIHPMEDFADYV